MQAFARLSVLTSHGASIRHTRQFRVLSCDSLSLCIHRQTDHSRVISVIQRYPLAESAHCGDNHRTVDVGSWTRRRKNRNHKQWSTHQFLSLRVHNVSCLCLQQGVSAFQRQQLLRELLNALAVKIARFGLGTEANQQGYSADAFEFNWLREQI